MNNAYDRATDIYHYEIRGVDFKCKDALKFMEKYKEMMSNIERTKAYLGLLNRMDPDENSERYGNRYYIKYYNLPNIEKVMKNRVESIFKSCRCINK